MKRQLIFLFLCIPILTSHAAEWQWSVQLKDVISDETNDHPQAFLWIPANCTQVRSIVVGKHNMVEEGIFEHPDFRKALTDLGFAIIWITPILDINWDVRKGIQEVFEKMLSELSEISGYTELKYVPIIPMGHSAMATYPWNFAAWNPERTLAILSIHGDSPRTPLTGYGGKNLNWGDRTLEGIPGLIVIGEYEWWEDRLFAAFDYRREHPNAPLSLLADAGRGHFDYSDGLVNYLALFLKKAARYRLPKEVSLNKPSKLRPVDARSGWLADRWHKDKPPRAKAAPYHTYKGDKDSAFWYFDKEMATVTAHYYEKARGKKEQYIRFLQNGKSPTFEPEEDGLTFHLKAEFTDRDRLATSDEHATGAITVNRICGPVEKVNDTTFTVRFYRMGLNNLKRTGDIWLLGMNNGDKDYKSTVQQLNIRIPHRNGQGSEQKIVFAPLNDIDLQELPRSVPLRATATSGLPVYYYIKEGPAEIRNNELHFTPLPPRAKYPLKITVVAWQYGIADQWKTAEAVERSFYLVAKSRP